VYLADRLSAGWFPRGGETDAVVRFLMANEGAWARIAAGILVVVIAPVTEELIFRGLLYGVVRRYGGRMAAIFTTSLLFAAIHANPAVLLPLFVLAVGLALACELTGSLWTPIAMHMAFNAISFALIVFFPGVLEWT
jgi:membrane protease YdiL (CAAX protease family)